VSADLALEGLHQSEGRIVSYSRIKGEMNDRIGAAIGVQDLRRSPAAEKAGQAEPQDKCGKCFQFHGLLSD